MRTQDFAAFISAHPPVRTFIETLLEERLTEEPAGSGDDLDPETMPGRQPPDDRAAAGSDPGPGRLADGKCTVVATNVLGFGGLLRSADDRYIVHTAMVDMTRSALTGIGEQCLFEDRGDGMLVVIPPAVPMPAVMERLTGTLPAALRRHNRVYNVCAQIQMSMAVDMGPVHSRDRGVTGKVLDRARQLLETPALTSAISNSRANLGVIVSSSVYDTAIRPHGAPGGYRQVQVEGKGRSQRPWIHMIDPVRTGRR
jgi:hypothetical protein